MDFRGGRCSRKIRRPPDLSQLWTAHRQFQTDGQHPAVPGADSTLSVAVLGGGQDDGNVSISVGIDGDASAYVAALRETLCPLHRSSGYLEGVVPELPEPSWNSSLKRRLKVNALSPSWEAGAFSITAVSGVGGLVRPTSTSSPRVQSTAGRSRGSRRWHPPSTWCGCRRHPCRSGRGGSLLTAGDHDCHREYHYGCCDGSGWVHVVPQMQGISLLL